MGAPGDVTGIGHDGRIDGMNSGDVCSRDGAGIGHVGGAGPDAVVTAGDGAGIGYIGCVGNDAVEHCPCDGAGIGHGDRVGIDALDASGDDAGIGDGGRVGNDSSGCSGDRRPRHDRDIEISKDDVAITVDVQAAAGSVSALIERIAGAGRGDVVVCGGIAGGTGRFAARQHGRDSRRRQKPHPQRWRLIRRGRIPAGHSQCPENQQVSIRRRL